LDNQDISVAGKGEGLDKGSGTRSGLLWEVERLLLQARENGTLPKYLLMENVKNLIGNRHKANFEKWLAFLDALGYKNYYKILNAKHYGIPQNRERVFCVSVLGEHKPFVFPEAVPLMLRLKDMLENEAAEKYYLDETSISRIIHSSYDKDRRRILAGNLCSCLSARDYKDPKCIVAGNLAGGKWESMHECIRRIYDTAGISPTITACSGGHHEPKIAAQRGRYNEDGKLEQQLEFNGTDISNTLTTVQKDNLVYLGYYKKNMQGYRIYDAEGVSATITARGGGAGEQGGALYKELEIYDDYNSRIRKDSGTIGTLTTNIGASAVRNGYKLIEKHLQKEDAETAKTIRCGGQSSFDNHSWDIISEGYMRIRKLTPRECLRLMGWNDEQIDKIQAAGISNSRQYKLAGNGIVVQVLEAVFRQMFLPL